MAGASAAYSRAAQQESASGRVEPWSKEELPGERKATKASRVATRPSTRWHEGVAHDEKKDEDEEQGGDLVLEGGLGPDQTETGVDDASRGEPARPQVTVGPGGTRTNAAEGVRGFGDGEAMTLQSQVRIKT